MPVLTHAPVRAHQRGITLLESLVALIITAIAILGVVGVQLRTLADTQTAVRRAQAVRLIDDLSERVKANPNALAVLDHYVQDWESSTSGGPDCSSGCNASNLASHDIAAWRASVQAVLPLGDATTFLVKGETINGARRQLGVMVSWRENERSGADADYRRPFQTPTTDAANADVECPEGRICHLQFIQPTARCTSDLRVGEDITVLFCPAVP